MYVDTHAHLNDPYFIKITGETADDLVKIAFENDVSLIFDIGTTEQISINAAKTAAKHPNVYASLAVHPSNVNQINGNVYNVFQKLIDEDLEGKIVGIGETGLDYHYYFTSPQQQKENFIKHLELAKKNDKTVIVHSRDAFDDTYEILSQYKDLRIIIHCFTYGKFEMEKFVSIGCWISFSGIITFNKNIEDIYSAVKAIPSDKILCETDSPLLTPAPFRGKINYPHYVKYVYDKISEIRNECVVELIMKNAKKAFNIK